MVGESRPGTSIRKGIVEGLTPRTSILCHAIDDGASKAELFEAIKAAAVPGGGVASSVEGRALQVLEQDGILR